jgi:hypothetical protein
MAWATISDTLSYTKITVDQGDVDSAQAVVELFADVTEASSDAGLISPKNLRLLKMAVAYQAAWATNQPDLYTRSDVGLMTQDGISFTSPHANSAILAPMAKRAIDRLSWRRNRSQRIRPMQPNNVNIGNLSGLGDYTVSDPWSDPTNNDASAEDNIPGWGSF